ncbi:enoyl-CoA hydratase/isomerase family protein [Chloroflexota bacterium]
MNDKTVEVEKNKGITIVRLNRPEVRNAINEQMSQGLTQAIKDAAGDDGTKVIVITGKGQAFCSGADFRFGKVREGTQATEQAEDLQSVHNEIKKGNLLHGLQLDINLALQRLGKPVIAMVNGDAVGAGMDIALSCDMRVGSQDARFSVAYTRMAVVPDGGATWLLPRLVGLGKALELILTGGLVSAEEAYRIGILNTLTTSDNLEEATMKLASKIANGPPIANRLSKMLVYKGLETDLETALQFLSACIPITTSSRDHQEAIKSFAEKRPPAFEGR